MGDLPKMSFIFHHPETDEPLEIEIAHHPFHPGIRGAFGEPETPDEQEGIAILGATNSHGQPIDPFEWDREIADAYFKPLR